MLVVDVVESVRLMATDEAGFIDAWRRFVGVVRRESLPPHGGVLAKSLGDGLLAHFDTAQGAASAAIAMLQAAESLGRFRLRIGLHSAEIVVDDIDVFGHGVNVAARLAAMAGPGEIIVSDIVRDALGFGLSAALVDLGECHLKHVAHPVRAFKLHASESCGLSWLSDPMEGATATLAILPLASRRDEFGGEPIGAAIADALIARLFRLPGLQIISSLSTSALAISTDPVSDGRRHLGAQFVVTGCCMVDGRHARGTIRLDDCRTGSTLWVDRIVVGVSDLFAGEDAEIFRIAERIADAVGRVTISRARRLPMPNLESFALLHGGVSLLHRLHRTDFDRARDLLLTLGERHPRAAAPLAMLAKWHMLRVLQGWASDPTDEGRKGLQVARVSLTREPDHALGGAMAALMDVHFGNGLESALATASAAIASDPQEAHAWMTLAGIHSYMHNGVESVRCAEQAIRLSPLDPCRYLFDLMLAAGQLASEEPEAALASAEISLQRNAVHLPTYRLAIIASVFADRPDDARRYAQRLTLLDPGYKVSSFVERYPGRDHHHAASYASALRAAGVPE